MNRNNGAGVRLLILTLAGLYGSSTGLIAARPNIVVFLIDDMGYMDIGANNPNCFYDTPHIDSLAESGMRFTSGYAANPVCSPTRYSIMTGKYPSRVDATNWFSGRRNGRYAPAPLYDRMDQAEFTLAEALSEQGYLTAFFGKWHLGPSEEFWPEHQGFEINIGGHNRGSPPGGYFSPYRNPRLEDGADGEHLPERLTREAIDVMKSAGDRPFFVYLSFYSVHTPLQGRQDLIDKYKVKGEKIRGDNDFAGEEQVWPIDRERKVRVEQNHAVYAAMVESMDEHIGDVLSFLKTSGLEENTIVCFTSDNGGLSTSEGSPTSNLPLRGGKGWTYEGGIREPFLVRWPGVTSENSVCDVPVMSLDLFPTLVKAGGGKIQRRMIVDGVDLMPLLSGKGDLKRDSLYWHYPHYSNQGGFPSGAIRSGPWKLIERYEDGTVHLYNLDNDIGEASDVAERYPQRVTSMRHDLHEWYRRVDAKFLEPLGDNTSPWRP